MGLTKLSSRVIIFDWDDTICPSSFLERCKVERFDELPSHLQRLSNEICRVAEKCLREASKHGQVLIITNSDDGWVQFSCKRFFPSLLPVINEYKVVSARTGYERFYPGQTLCWKAAAFAHEVNEVFDSSSPSSSDPFELDTSCQSLESTDISSTSDESNNMQVARNIISFGDSMEERTAVRIVADQLSANPKSVMFIQTPTPTQIIGQLHMLAGHMKFICESEDSLDLEITSEQAESYANSYLNRKKMAVQRVSADVCDEFVRPATQEGNEIVTASSSG